MRRMITQQPPLMQVQIDHDHARELAEISDILDTMPEVLANWIARSGNGLKGSGPAACGRKPVKLQLRIDPPASPWMKSNGAEGLPMISQTIGRVLMCFRSGRPPGIDSVEDYL